MEKVLLEIFGWGYLDAEKLATLIEQAELYDVEVEDIRNAIKDYDGDLSQINTWIYETLIQTACAFVLEFRKWATDTYPKISDRIDLEGKLDEFTDELSPFCNYLDSFFNNVLDEYDLSNKEESFRDFLKYLLNK